MQTGVGTKCVAIVNVSYDAAGIPDFYLDASKPTLAPVFEIPKFGEQPHRQSSAHYQQATVVGPKGMSASVVKRVNKALRTAF